MNLKNKKWQTILRNCLGGLLFIILINIVYFFVILIFIHGLEIEMEFLRVISFLFSIWFLTCPLICLYWIYKPAEWFWWKHKYISHAIAYGSFFGCVVIIAAGIHFLLWFFPDSEKGFHARFLISGAIGFIATFALWNKLNSDLERRLEDARTDRFREEVLDIKGKLASGNANLVGVTRKIEELLQRADKLSPVENIRLNALEQAWHDEKDLEENIRRIRELHRLMIKDKLDSFRSQRLFDLLAEFEDSYGNLATKHVLDFIIGTPDLAEIIKDQKKEENNSKPKDNQPNG